MEAGLGIMLVVKFLGSVLNGKILAGAMLLRTFVPAKDRVILSVSTIVVVHSRNAMEMEMPHLHAARN